MATPLEMTFQAALRAHQAGDLTRAEQGYNAVLGLKPAFAPALHYLGLVTYQRGDAARAITLVERALALQPTLTDAHYNLGNIFRETGDSARAEACYRRVLRTEAKHPGALLNLANLLREKAAPAEAEPLLRQLLTVAPAMPGLHDSLGAVLLDLGKRDEALRHLRRAVELAPRASRPHFNLAAALEKTGDLASAETEYRQALTFDPNDAEALNNLGNTLLARHRPVDALEIFERLADRHSDHAGYARNLAIALHRNGRLTEAVAKYEALIAQLPADAALRANLGSVFSDQGRIDDAIAAYRAALALDADNAVTRSNMLFALCFKEDADPQMVFEEHRRFDDAHAAALTAAAPPHRNDRSPERRLRVGYVSPDFHRHPCGHFLLPVFEHRDPSAVELFAYSVGSREDGFTARFRAAADHWVSCPDVSDAALAERVRADAIDILVDCAGHMRQNRLLAFARKPAPIQVSFPLYPNTTGLSAIDYRIMDPHFAPPGADALHSERIIRLPDTHVCYEPGYRDIPVAPAPPSHTSGIVTFGSFNNMAKIGGRTVAVWARILHAVPGSRLRMKWLGLGASESSALLDRFAAHGVGAERLDLIGWSPDPYRPYLDIDICLDPLFANGGTTTCDALWMGVPVITRPGETPFSRVGLGHLTNVGLPELIAPDDDSYVALAVDLARSPERLTQLRAGLRERFARSPLMDAARYTRHLEDAYRRCWIEWCRSG